ncbi:MAG: hypothetical protein WCJ29_01575 [bacterium]
MKDIKFEMKDGEKRMPGKVGIAHIPRIHRELVAANEEHQAFESKNGRTVPKIGGISVGFLEGNMKKQGINPREEDFKPIGALTLDEMTKFRAGQCSRNYPGLRAAYCIEHDGEKKLILLMGGSMGGTPVAEGGGSPVIRVASHKFMTELSKKSDPQSMPIAEVNIVKQGRGKSAVQLV